MSLFVKGALSFTTVAYVQELPIPNETAKMIISGIFSLASVGIVELFKYLKARRASKKITQTNAEQSKQPEHDFSKSRQITPTADDL